MTTGVTGFRFGGMSQSRPVFVDEGTIEDWASLFSNWHSTTVLSGVHGG